MEGVRAELWLLTAAVRALVGAVIGEFGPAEHASIGKRVSGGGFGMVALFSIILRMSPSPTK